MKRRQNHKTATPAPAPAGNAVVKKKIEVEFKYESTEAESVHVAGSFNDWRIADLRLNRDKSGAWSLPLHLPPGRYEYRFIVDGEWRDDPRADTRVQNEFGSSNAVIEVS